MIEFIPPNRLSLAQLKTLTTKGSEAGLSAFLRQLMLYPTWLLLKTPLSANGATALSVLFALAGAACYVTRLPDLLGAGFFLLAHAFDYVDGGIARARQTGSWKGAVLDSVFGDLTMGILLIALSINVYQNTSMLLALVLGQITLLLYLLAKPYPRYLISYVNANHSLPPMQSVSNYDQIESQQGIIFQIVRLVALDDIRYLFFVPLMTTFGLQVLVLAFTALHSCLTVIIHYFRYLRKM